MYRDARGLLVVATSPLKAYKVSHCRYVAVPDAVVCPVWAELHNVLTRIHIDGESVGDMLASRNMQSMSA